MEGSASRFGRARASRSESSWSATWRTSRRPSRTWRWHELVDRALKERPSRPEVSTMSLTTSRAGGADLRSVRDLTSGRLRGAQGADTTDRRLNDAARGSPIEPGSRRRAVHGQPRRPGVDELVSRRFLRDRVVERLLGQGQRRAFSARAPSGAWPGPAGGRRTPSASGSTSPVTPIFRAPRPSSGPWPARPRLLGLPDDLLRRMTFLLIVSSLSCPIRAFYADRFQGKRSIRAVPPAAGGVLQQHFY